MTTVTIGMVSVVDNCNAQQAELIHLLKFSHIDSYDLGEIVPTSTLALALNSCSIDLDPGIIDRTYLLLNYADLDHDCVRTVTTASTSSNSNITVTVTITSPTASWLTFPLSGLTSCQTVSYYSGQEEVVGRALPWSLLSPSACMIVLSYRARRWRSLF